MSTRMSSISIIVPIYNVEKYIERCAISLFEQTYENIEYVFVNDCTPDGSVEVLNQVIGCFADRSRQAKIINHDRNRGVAAARNTGIQNCTGDFICQVDPDDYLEKNAIELLLKKQAETGADIVTGNMMMHRKGGDSLLPFPRYSSKKEMVIDMMQTTIHHSLANRMIRKSLYDNYQVEAKEGVNCGEDCWMMTRLAYYADSFSHIDEAIYHYDKTREDSYTTAKKNYLNKKKIKDDIATAKLIIDFFKDKEQVFYDEANTVALNYMNNVLFSCARMKDQPYFYEILSQMKSIDKKYWGLINWDKSYWRSMAQNFYSCRILGYMMRIYGQMISKIKS